MMTLVALGASALLDFRPSSSGMPKVGGSSESGKGTQRLLELLATPSPRLKVPISRAIAAMLAYFNQPVGGLKGQGIKQGLVDDVQDGGVGADSDRQRQNDQRGVVAIFPQTSDGVTQVTHSARLPWG